MRHSIAVIFVTAFLGVAFLGCNSSSGLVSPEVSYPNNFQTSQNGENPALGNSAEAASPHQLMSLSQVYYNPADESFELVPVRLSELHLNIKKWLDGTPCSECIKIAGIQNLGGGVFNIDFQITHPFPDPTYTAFDTRGIVLFNGSRNYPASGLTAPDSSLGDGELLNADGYTTLYNSSTLGDGPDGLQGFQGGSLSTPVIPSALLNGYKRHYSSYPSNTRNALFDGDSSAATYKIDLPDSVVVFGFAVDVSWDIPLVNPVTDPMTQFGPNANCPEAWKIDVVATPVGDGLTEFGGEDQLTIDVYDWQGKDSTFPLVVECPELFDGFVAVPFLQDGVGYTRYQASISNSKNAPVGSYKVLIGKTSSENNPVYPWLDLTAYQIFTVEINPSINQLPVAAASANPNPQNAGSPVHFSGAGSNDPDGGAIVSYEWDWNNDGVYESTGAEIDHTFSGPGVYSVQLRVTDNEASTDTLNSPLQVTINSTQATWDNTIGTMLHSNCASCHISGSAGGKNYSTYQNFVNSNVVDLANPPNSKIYKKVKNHTHDGDLTDPQLAILLAWIAAGIPEN
ncbi:MAG: PKD domain-containing protein [bacterium]|nr:PKD domain-containing protein [bacterium]